MHWNLLFVVRSKMKIVLRFFPVDREISWLSFNLEFLTTYESSKWKIQEDMRFLAEIWNWMNVEMKIPCNVRKNISIEDPLLCNQHPYDFVCLHWKLSYENERKNQKSHGNSRREKIKIEREEARWKFWDRAPTSLKFLGCYGKWVATDPRMGAWEQIDWNFV